MFVQFGDSTEKTIIAAFSNAQDGDTFPNQGEVDPADARYAEFYNSLPELAKSGLTAPT